MQKQTLGTAVVAVILASGAVHAEVVDEFDVGIGESTSTTIFQFGNGNQYIFNISYDGAPTGRDSFDVITEEMPEVFIPVIKSYDFGDFLLGLSIGDDENSGFGTPPDYFDYWHYWTKETMADAWESSMIGFSDRILSDGSMDGWVFDSGDAPIPAPPAFIGLMGIGLMRKRRR